MLLCIKCLKSVILVYLNLGRCLMIANKKTIHKSPNDVAVLLATLGQHTAYNYQYVLCFMSMNKKHLSYFYLSNLRLSSHWNVILIIAL